VASAKPLEGMVAGIEESKGKVYITNASQITLSNAQTQMLGEAENAGFQTEDDVVAYIKELRKAR